MKAYRMTINKLIKTALQGCVNSYGGEYGDVREVFDSWEFFKEGHVEGYFAYMGTKLFIIFRGSDGLLDWLDNFKFWQKTIPYREAGVNKRIRIHTGFYQQYRYIRPLVFKRIDSILNRSQTYVKDIIICGHSLGGALATLCAVDLDYNHGVLLDLNRVRLSCITFGSPRVGNKVFKKSFDKRVINSVRIVNGDDSVCKVPLPIFGYRHVKAKIQIGERKWWKYFFGSTKDHNPDGCPSSYMENLK